MSDAARRLEGRAILIVEDDYFIMDGLRRRFEAQGAEIIGTAPTVDAALALVAAAPRLDAAVLDINLQGRMAFQVAEALAARGAPFVFVTGYDNLVVPGRYDDVRRFEKPTPPDAIVRSISQMLDL